MDNTNESEDLIENILDDDYIFVTENNIDEGNNMEMNWIELDFTENDLTQFEKENYTSHKSDVDDNSSDEMLPSRWEVIKERADKAARLAIAVPVIIVLTPVVLPVAGLYFGLLMYTLMLNERDSIFA